MTSVKPASIDDATPAAWLRRVWERMDAMFTNTWTSTHGVSPQSTSGALTIHGETWGKALSGLTGRQIGIGLEACMTSGAEFPPSAPTFRAMCLQVPRFAAVKLEFFDAARSGERAASAFARLTYQFLDTDRFRYGNSKAAEDALRDAYQLAREHLLEGGDYPPEPVAAIAHEAERKPTPEEREAAKASFEACKAAVLSLYATAPEAT